MKSFKSTSTFASVVYLLPVLLLCGAAAMYFLYQGKLESADAAREQAIEAEADSQVTAVNSQVRQLRAEIIETGELLLRQLPLPLSGDPEIVLRELNQDMASRETAWGEVFIVSLDSNARQFYYDARGFQTGLLDLVSQGERAGPRAFRTADGFELFIAEPLSNPDWVAVARISRSGLAGPLATGLGDVGQVTIEQVIGETDAMTLFTFGETPAGSELSRTPSVQGWRLTFAPSQAFLDRHSSSATGPFILVLVFGLGFVLSLAFAGWTYSRQGKEPLTAPSTQTKESDEPKSKKEKAGLIGKLSGKKSEPVEEELDPLEEEADDPQAEFETDVDDDFTPLTAEQLPAKIFRANDIRGLAGEQITESFARHLGRCFAMMAKESGADKVFIGRDPRNDSEALSEALSQGISESGCDVVNVGLCATPVLAWAMQSQDATAAVMVTASHNPSEYNGFKLILDGTTLQSEGIRKLRESMVRAKFKLASADLNRLDPTDDYVEALEVDIAPLKGMKVVVDAANGAAGPIAVKALSAMGCLVDALYCEPDGNFPNHQPDPSRPENIEELRERVKKTQAHLGIALDGDGDRMVAVDEMGEPLDPDQLMMLFAEQVLTINPAANIVSDVKSSRTLADFIERLGGRSLTCRSGRSFVQSAFRESHAMLAGEYSSHYFFGDRWTGFDDGVYAASRLLEILVLYNKPFSEVVADLPKQMSTPEIIIKIPDEDKFDIVQRFSDAANFPGAKLLEIDGIRVEYREAWGLLRASNTSPALTLRFEARSEGALQKIQSMFREQLKAVAPDIQLDF
jgi:phosphomannomutase/phosphoglucomutase